jgi:hypothetical protein
MDRNAVSIAMPKEQHGFSRAAVHQNVQQRAAAAAVRGAFFVTMHQQVAMAEIAGHLVRLIPADTRSSLIPIENPALTIDHVQAFFELIEQRSVQLAVHEGLLQDCVAIWAGFSHLASSGVISEEERAHSSLT